MPGYKLHSGRSRNEQIATDLRLYVRAAIDQLRNDLSRVVRQFSWNAPSRPAMRRCRLIRICSERSRCWWRIGCWPTWRCFCAMRDGWRIAAARLNVCPLGSGAVAGTTLPLDRRAMAAELGFDGPTANSMDATSDRDFVLEFVNTLSLLALHLSRWAEEMMLFSTQEYGFVRLPEAYSTGSSAMPQKKNRRSAGAGARQSGARQSATRRR